MATIQEKAVEWAIQTAQNNAHGYSQIDRWGPDYDCSSFVIQAYEQAGIALREAGASYTGNMRPALLACGFSDVTGSVNLNNGNAIRPGDILYSSGHTCLAIGNGKVANCRTDEGHPQSGDQGQEIRIQSYWNFPWTQVFRLTRNTQVETMPEGDFESGSYLDGLASVVGASKPKENAKDKPATFSQNAKDKLEDHHWKPGTLERAVKYNVNHAVLQSLLTARGFNCGQIDGYFGPLTEIAVNHAKRYYGMVRDGKCDYALWIKLLLIER